MFFQLWSPFHARSVSGKIRGNKSRTKKKFGLQTYMTTSYSQFKVKNSSKNSIISPKILKTFFKLSFLRTILFYLQNFFSFFLLKNKNKIWKSTILQIPGSPGGLGVWNFGKKIQVLFSFATEENGGIDFTLESK